MGFKVAQLWQAPDINPVNGKARSIPVLNPINKYGRVFLFSWWGFMIAFWSWYAFPPLLTLTIKKDLKLSQNEIANSNIIALVGTLLVRVVAGPACDRYGARVTFAACLLLGALPTALAGTVHSATGLMVLRFFVGILGGAFVPCQVWSTGFFDKNVVGTANALTGGWGNTGGGITYFIMPAIFDSLVSKQNLTPHVAWRVAFIVPFILITVTAILMLVLCPDTPQGKWSERQLHVQESLQVHGIKVDIIDAKGSVTGNESAPSTSNVSTEKRLDEEADISRAKRMPNEHEIEMSEQGMLDEAQGEVIAKPTLKEAMQVIFSPQTLTLVACYLSSFGAELAINSSLGAYYLKNFPQLGQTGTGRWAAMFGLLNLVSRPIGGIFADIIYQKTGSVWGKKIWLHSLAIICGAFQIAVGVKDSHSKATMFGLVAGMGFFLEASNGANFALVPHVHPFANGIVSGAAGACGNLGGVIFAIIFRYQGVDYGKTLWVIGVITIGINICVSWIPPIPKGQIGGR
ncbi:hypothetical protein B7463_g6657, partial [Scytalidium lignicola]